MEIKVAELMDFYTPPAETGAVYPERVRARTIARLGAARRKRRLRTAAIAAALAALLAVGAAAAKQIGFDELPALLRRCFGIDGTVETGLRYDRVTEAPDARTADVGGRAAGELSVTRGTALRSESLYVIDLYVSAVTSEQLTDLVWRVRERGGETWAAEVLEDRGGWAALRAAFPASVFDGGAEAELELCCGAESADGSTFEIQRVGIFRPLPIAYQAAAELSCDLPLTETAALTGIEFSSSHLILRIDAPSLVVGFGALTSNRSPALLEEANALDAVLFRAVLRFGDGGETRFFPSGGSFCDGEYYYLAMTLGESERGREPAAFVLDGTVLPFEG